MREIVSLLIWVLKLFDHSSYFVAPSCQGQSETTEADAMFILEDGATISNAIIGASQAEGIHCRGTWYALSISQFFLMNEQLTYL